MAEPRQDRREESEEGGFRVEDRRAFTPQGDRRPGTGAPRVERPRAPDPPPSGAKPGETLEETPFLRLIGGVAAGAYAGLGLIPDPATGTRRLDLAAAREAIDLLAALREKTAGNLDPSEREMLEGALSELQFLFVQRTSEKGPSG